MSALERQQAAFIGNMSSAATQISTGKKRTRGPPSPSPSVTSTTSAPAGATPKKERDHTPSVFSQPANTGFGETNIAQISYAIQWLRSKAGQPQTLDDVLSYLSILGIDEARKATFAENMQKNPRIEWIPDPDLSEQTWRTGTYVHRPIINVKTRTELMAYLQAWADATPVEVKDLKDGWPECEKGINELEKEHKILVVRAKKDGVPRLVWQDDSSLHHEVDPQFMNMWNRVEIPPVDSIVQRLKAVGQKATSDDPRDKTQAPKVEKKKKRAARRAGKTTNLHMEHLLQDYSHYKK